jgi:hypothetical protein
MTNHYSPLIAVVCSEIDRLALVDSNRLSTGLREFDRSLSAEVRAARHMQELENHPTLASGQRSFRVETTTVFGNEIQQERLWESGFRCYGLNPAQLLEPFLTRLSTEHERYHTEGCYTRKLRWEPPYMSDWSLAPSEGQFPTVRLLKHFLVFGARQDVDVDRFAIGELRKKWGPVQDAIATLLLYTNGKTFAWSGDRFVSNARLHDELTEDRLGGCLQGPASGYVIVMMETWRVVEEDIFKRSWDQPLRIPFQIPQGGSPTGDGSRV